MPVGPLSLSDEVALDLGLKVIKATEADLGPNAINPDQKKLMVELVEKHHEELVRKHEALFIAELPAAQDPKVRDRMMENVVVALDKLVKKYYADEFKRHFTSMSETWNSFPPAALPEKNDHPISEQLMGELMDLVAVKLARHKAGNDAEQ